jgi:hypothetical protein
MKRLGEDWWWMLIKHGRSAGWCCQESRRLFKQRIKNTIPPAYLDLSSVLIMKLSTSIAIPLLASTCSAAAIHGRQSGDGPQGSGDATQGDLGGRPLPQFPFPILEFPVAKETVVLNETMYIMPGQVFDGQMKRYERQEGSCNEQAEGTDADTVFNLMPGATIRNVIIGKNQAEGIHALGDAWVENGKTLVLEHWHTYADIVIVWWEDVCEDALTSKGLNTQLRVIGGGAKSATDKVSLPHQNIRIKSYLRSPDLPRQLPRRQVQHYRLFRRYIWYLLPILWKLLEPGQAQRYYSERRCHQWHSHGHSKLYFFLSTTKICPNPGHRSTRTTVTNTESRTLKFEMW